MRRWTKKSLRKFDGTPLFPERLAYTVPYALSDGEAALYKAVTAYVRDGWQDFMVPMLVRALEECPRRESREELEALVIDFVDHLTGKQTIYQMLRLNEEVEPCRLASERLAARS